MILVPLYLFWKNKTLCLSKALISEVEHTKYNKSFTTDEFSKEYIAKEVSRIITEEYEEVLIERFVKANYSFMEPLEQQAVIEEAKGVAKNEKGGSFPKAEERQNIIYNSVLEYLSDNKVIVPCGFVDFRFRDEYFWVEGMCAMGADMYFDKREYEEFTYLLSVFVESKECKEEVIHVIWQEGIPLLFNKRGRDVTKKYQKDFILKAKTEDLTGDDMAISAIIAASPEKIVLHKPPVSPLKNAVEKIFSQRCRICTGCNVCEKY